MSLRIAAAVLVALLGGASLAGSAEPAAGRVALPVIKVEKGGECVAPAAEMRRNHMKMLLHQRDRTMHDGIRTTRFSLKQCVECHASSKTGSVLGQEGFCSSCHAYASVSIDCFECHSPMRQTSVSSKP